MDLFEALCQPRSIFMRFVEDLIRDLRQRKIQKEDDGLDREESLEAKPFPLPNGTASLEDLYSVKYILNNLLDDPITFALFFGTPELNVVISWKEMETIRAAVNEIMGACWEYFCLFSKRSVEFDMKAIRGSIHVKFGEMDLVAVVHKRLDRISELAEELEEFEVEKPHELRDKDSGIDISNHWDAHSPNDGLKLETVQTLAKARRREEMRKTSNEWRKRQSDNPSSECISESNTAARPAEEPQYFPCGRTDRRTGEMCRFRFRTKEERDEHWRVDHREEDGTFPCGTLVNGQTGEMCSAIFRTTTERERHWNESHFPQSQLDESSTSESSDDSTTEHVEPVQHIAPHPLPSLFREGGKYLSTGERASKRFSRWIY